MAPRRKAPAATTKSTRARATRSTSKESTVPPSPSKPTTSQRKSIRGTRATSGEPVVTGRSLRGRSTSEEPKNELFGLDDPEKALKAARKRRNVSETPSRGTTPDVELEMIPVTYPAVNNDYNPTELSTIREESTIELTTPRRSARHNKSVSNDLSSPFQSIEDKPEEDIQMAADANEQLHEELYEEVHHEMTQQALAQSPEASAEQKETQLQDDQAMAQSPEDRSAEISDNATQDHPTPRMYARVSYSPSDMSSDPVSPNFHELAANGEIAVSTPSPDHVSGETGIEIVMPPISPPRRLTPLQRVAKYLPQSTIASANFKPFALSPAPVDPRGYCQNWYHKDGWGRYQPVLQLRPQAWLKVKKAELAFSYPEYQMQLELLNHTMFHMVNTELQTDTREALLPQLIHLQGLLDYVSHDPAVNPTAGYAAQAKFYTHKLVKQVTAMEEKKAKAEEQAELETEARKQAELETQAEPAIASPVSTSTQEKVAPVTPTNSVFVNKSQTEVKQSGWFSSFVSPFKLFGSRTQPVNKIASAPSTNAPAPASPIPGPSNSVSSKPNDDHDPRRGRSQPLEHLQAAEDTKHPELYAERDESADQWKEIHTRQNPPHIRKEPDYARIAWTFGNKRKLAADMETVKRFEAELTQNLRAPYNAEELHFVKMTLKKQAALEAHQARLKAGRGRPQSLFAPSQVAGQKRSSPHRGIDADGDIENENPERSSKRLRHEDIPPQDGSPTPKSKGKLPLSLSPRLPAIGYTSPIPGDPEFRHVNEELPTPKAISVLSTSTQTRADGSSQPTRSIGMTFAAPDPDEDETDTSFMSSSSAASHAARRLEQERSGRAQRKRTEVDGIIKRHEVRGGTTYGLDDAFFESDSDDEYEPEAVQNSFQPSLSSTPGPGAKRKYTEAELEAKAEELERREAALRQLEEEVTNKRQRLNEPNTLHTPQWTQAPPPAPIPSHAQLPNGAQTNSTSSSPVKSSHKSTPNVFPGGTLVTSEIVFSFDMAPGLKDGAKERMEELIAKQKAQANKFAPKKPSGLREASRYSSPAISESSDAGISIKGRSSFTPVQSEHPSGTRGLEAATPLGSAVTGEITPPASPTEKIGFGMDPQFQPVPIPSVFGPGVIPDNIDISEVLAAMHKEWDPLLRYWDEE